MGKKFKVSRKTKKIILGGCIGAMVILIAGLFIYLYIADTNTLGRKIAIYGLDVSTLTVDKAEQKILKDFRERKVAFQEDGATVYETTLGNLGYDLNEDALKTQLTELQKTREANRKLFATQEDQKIPYEIQKNENQEKASLQESNFGDKERTASVDAAIQYNEDQKKFTLISDVQGNQIDESRLLAYVDQSLESLFPSQLLGGEIKLAMGTDVYQQPLGSETEVVDASTIESWLQISSDSISVDQDAIKTYIQDLATKYNTIYVPRTFHTSYGNDVTVSDNEYGFQIDQDGEMQQLLKDIASGSEVSRDPVYSISAMQRNGSDDLAGSYIEVSLDNQHLWLYKDGALVTETDIVSGAPKAGRETYRGAWPIAYKASPYNLSSSEYGYNVTVKYWMPFVYGQGLHDASWQSSFGGNRYKSGAGSHGCINLPTDQAALIYNTIDGGYPIIIY